MNGYSNLGAAYMLAGSFSAALSAFQKALEIEPKKIAYSNLGLMHYYLGQLDESIANHQLAIELEPGDHLAWSNLGDALSIAGHTDEARVAFVTARSHALEALDVNPNDPFYAMDLAWIEAMLDDSAEARTLINRALALAPEDPYTHYYNALILLRDDEYSAAIAALDTAIELGYPRQLLAAEPHLDKLANDSRFLELLNEK
jgi:Flp pilus assembly protein TadD